MILSDILKDSNYKLTQFSQEHIQSLEKGIIKRDEKLGYYTVCLVRKKEIKLYPSDQLHIARKHFI